LNFVAPSSTHHHFCHRSFITDSKTLNGFTKSLQVLCFPLTPSSLVHLNSSPLYLNSSPLYLNSSPLLLTDPSSLLHLHLISSASRSHYGAIFTFRVISNPLLLGHSIEPSSALPRILHFSRTLSTLLYFHLNTSLTTVCTKRRLCKNHGSTHRCSLECSSRLSFRISPNFSHPSNTSTFGFEKAQLDPSTISDSFNAVQKAQMQQGFKDACALALAGFAAVKDQQANNNHRIYSKYFPPAPTTRAIVTSTTCERSSGTSLARIPTSAPRILQTSPSVQNSQTRQRQQTLLHEEKHHGVDAQRRR
jgi:hypothetical protein